MSDKCTIPGCQEAVPKPGFKLCYKHWKESKAQAEKAPAPVKPAPRVEEELLSATALGERLSLSGQRTNQVLSELGWISREKKGWVANEPGLTLGAIQREHHQTGIPFVLWPASVTQNKVLLATVKSVTGQETQEKKVDAPQTEPGFREKFAATHRATDGHWVRSRAEMLVDNWLYMAGIVHAYERQLPIEEELYCDFYIPSGKVYLEYWGLENDPKYEARKKVKLELYRKYNFNLIQLTDEHIRNLDDHLPKMLLKFNVLVS